MRGLLLLGDQPLQLLLQLVAVELGDQVALLDALAVVDEAPRRRCPATGA